ncbi:hypothetical protein BaRGS_00008687, partial [Batillaria attramentaria]
MVRSNTQTGVPYASLAMSKLGQSKDEEGSLHGSNLSLVSTSSSHSVYSSSEEKHAAEVRKLKRDLEAAQAKVHTLTSQLSTNNVDGTGLGMAIPYQVLQCCYLPIVPPPDQHQRPSLHSFTVWLIRLRLVSWKPAPHRPHPGPPTSPLADEMRIFWGLTRSEVIVSKLTLKSRAIIREPDRQRASSSWYAQDVGSLQLVVGGDKNEDFARRVAIPSPRHLEVLEAGRRLRCRPFPYKFPKTLGLK